MPHQIGGKEEGTKKERKKKKKKTSIKPIRVALT
jgi:hypothetical protein